MVELAQGLSTGAAPARARAPWGHTALIIHGLAWAFGITTWLILASGWLDSGERIREYAGVASTGWGACLVLAIWSARLAVRALIARERVLCPVLVFVFLLILSLAISADLWRHIILDDRRSGWESCAIGLGVPVFLPFGAVAGAVAALAGWWISGWLGKRDKAWGAGMKLDPRNPKRWLVCSSLVFTLLTMTVLPFPLYLYCVTTVPYCYPDPGSWTSPNWRNGLTRVMPDYVKNLVHDALAGSSFQTLKVWHLTVVEYGHLPASALRSNLLYSNLLCQPAWEQFSQLRPGEALGLAESIGDGQTPAFVTPQEVAGRLVAERASHEKVLSYLHSAQTQRSPFLVEMVNWLSRYRRGPEFVNELKALASGASPNRPDVLAMILRLVTAEERTRLWSEFAKDPVPARRLAAALAMIYCGDGEVRERFFAVYLADEDISVRRLGASHILFRFNLRSTRYPTGLDLHWIAKLTELLDDPDLGIRRSAALALHWATPDEHRDKSIPQSILGNLTANRGPETPAEITARGQIGAAAQEWLEKLKERRK